MGLKLDLGCGQKCREGFEGVDIAPGQGVAHIVDLFVGGWPFADDSVDEVWCSHLVEHTPNLIAFMDELYRIMAPNAIATLIAPYYTSMRAFQDPTHVRFITDATFVYFDAHWRRRERLDHYPIKADFEQIEVRHAIHPDFSGASSDTVRLAMKHQWNVIEDIQVTLRKR
jgi:SAM-dependent methyltransferase